MVKLGIGCKIEFLNEMRVGNVQRAELWRAIVGFRSDRAGDERRGRNSKSKIRRCGSLLLVQKLGRLNGSLGSAAIAIFNPP